MKNNNKNKNNLNLEELEKVSGGNRRYGADEHEIEKILDESEVNIVRNEALYELLDCMRKMVNGGENQEKGITMENNNKNKNNLNPEELEKVSGGTDESKPNINKSKLPKLNLNRISSAVQTCKIIYEKLKKLAEEEKAKEKKEKAETTLLPKEPEKNN